VTVAIDDGGSSITAPTSVTLDNGQQCQIADATGGTCEFVGLMRNRTYGYVVSATNALGVRTAAFSAKTLMATPDRPLLAAEFKGSDLYLTMTTSERDRTNVMKFLGSCLVNYKWKDSARIDLELKDGESSMVFTIPNSRKKLIQCSIYSYAPGAPKGDGSDSVRLTVLKSGKIQLPRISATLVATSPRRGVVVLKWRVVDKNGRVEQLSVRTSKKTCAYRGRTTCTITRLKSGSTYAAVVQAYGPSGAISKRTTVVVK
jgi:hypothetical protein